VAGFRRLDQRLNDTTEDCHADQALLPVHAYRRFLIPIVMGGDAVARDYTKEESNKALVQASFDRWKSGTGGPFELLAPDAEWTNVGSSPLSKSYRSKKEFLDSVINPFNTRMSTVLVPTIRGIYAGGDTVISVRCRSHGEGWKTLSKYLYLAFSDEGRAGRQSNRFLRHKGFRRILEPRVSNALKDAPGASKPRSPKRWGCGSTGICLCGQPMR
jgi:hypothetical protein